MDVWGHRQGTLNTKPVWADAQMRVDPYALPQKIAYDRAPISGSARDRSFEFTLNDDGATLKCDMTCGLPLSLSLPKRAFMGVAARAFENEDGSNTVTLELMHRDSELSVPLCVSNAVEDTASDWHSWAKRLGLPMLMVDEAGEISVVQDHNGITSRTAKPRRRRAAMMKRRPNFMRRRKVGMVGPVVRISAREIIART